MNQTLFRDPNVYEMDANQSKELLVEICNIFGIGILSRDRQTILTNIQNAARRSDCLWEIEEFHTVTVNEAGNTYQECHFGWGDTPEEYGRKYRELLATRQ